MLSLGKNTLGERGADFMFALTRSKGVSFNLDAFMATQADGLYFDTTKTDRFFQESTGPTLADDVGEAIGLALSQRAWNGQTLAEVLAGQPELVTNGEFTTDLSGWSDEDFGTGNSYWEDGAARLIGADTSNRAIRRQNLTVTAGRAFEVTARLRSLTSGSITLRVGSSAGGTDLLPDTALNTTELRRFVVSTGPTLSFQLMAITGNGLVENISVKEVPGKHGIQATGTLKPTRQTTGAKFDGSDDNWLTSYTAGAGENFIVALVDVPASLSANQYFFGSYKASGALRFHLGFDPTGLVRYGLGTASAAVGGDRRGTTCVVGMSTDGSTFRVFDENAEAASGAMSGVVSDVVCRIGALNFDGTASTFFGGSIKKLVAGRQFLDLATYRKIRNALLA